MLPLLLPRAVFQVPVADGGPAGGGSVAASSSAAARVVTSPQRLVAAVRQRQQQLQQQPGQHDARLASGEALADVLEQLAEDVHEYDVHVYSRMSRRDRMRRL